MSHPALWHRLQFAFTITSFQPAPTTTRLVVLLAILCLAGAATSIVAAVQPPLTLTATTRARALRPGEVILVTILPSRAIQSLEGTAFDNPIHAWKATAESEWQALVGIPLTIKPAAYEVVLHGRTSDGHEAIHRVPLIVERGRFSSRRLTVDPQFVNPPASAMDRIAREAKSMAQLFAHPTPDRLWHGPFRMPVPGASTSSFGRLSILNGESRSRHQGADFRAAEGTDVRAPNAGRVVVADDFYFSGNTVILDHGAGLFSLFAHFSKINVALGALVKSGDLLGEAGATGRVTGPHVHWAVRLNGASVDPLSLADAVAEIPD